MFSEEASGRNVSAIVHALNSYQKKLPENIFVNIK